MNRQAIHIYNSKTETVSNVPMHERLRNALLPIWEDRRWEQEQRRREWQRGHWRGGDDRRDGWDHERNRWDHRDDY